MTLFVTASAGEAALVSGVVGFGGGEVLIGVQ
jgi:hypothetical protein